MATEFLYDCIKTVSGEDINIGAQITDVDGNNITSGCSLIFINKDFSTIAEYAGAYADGEWTFVIPAAATQGMEGRYWYRISYNDNSMSFAAPIYLEV